MTASAPTPHAAGAGPAKHTGIRVVVGILGLAALVIGVILLFHPYAAARTLALFVGLALILGGLMEAVLAWDAERRVGSMIVGAVLVIGGLLAAFWPGVTLATVAVIAGLSLILHGIGRIWFAIAARREMDGWGWLAVAGGVNIVIGVLALVWPQATVLVLSVIFGLQIIAFGLLLIASAFWRPEVLSRGSAA
jgi:uncharacterized membrane protein HdeD (DUF308 family)